jgi:hypothetical protein
MVMVRVNERTRTPQYVLWISRVCPRLRDASALLRPRSVAPLTKTFMHKAADISDLAGHCQGAAENFCWGWLGASDLRP